MENIKIMAKILNRTGENLSLDKMIYLCFTCGMELVAHCFEKDGLVIMTATNKRDIELTRIGPTYIASELIFNNNNDK